MKRIDGIGRIAGTGTILTVTPRIVRRRRAGGPMDEEKMTYTISEAARIKDVRRTTIHAAIQAGRLNAHTETVRTAAGLERQIWMIDRADLEAWQPMSRQESGRHGADVRWNRGEQE